MSSEVSTQLVGLGLNREGPASNGASDAAIFRSTLDEALDTLATVIDATDTAATADAKAAVLTCRSQLAAGVPAEVLDPIARTCFASTRHVAAHGRDHAAEQRTRAAALVTMVRETVATLGGDQTSLDDTLAGSVQRLGQLARVDDLQQIQARLFEEVATLKRVTLERRAAWEQTVQQFGTRLSTLETQLDLTRKEAAVDPLTNIANRRTFEATCRQWLGPHRPGFVMAMADVDDFKAINDRHGHGVGDRVLVTVAETLARSLRAGDLVARLGGDEFVLLAAGLTLRQAEGRLSAISRDIRNACQGLVPDGAAPSMSIGIAECSAGDTLESLQQRADAALYEAKRGGKGRLAAKASPLIRDLRGLSR